MNHAQGEDKSDRPDGLSVKERIRALQNLRLDENRPSILNSKTPSNDAVIPRNAVRQPSRPGKPDLPPRMLTSSQISNVSSQKPFVKEQPAVPARPALLTPLEISAPPVDGQPETSSVRNFVDRNGRQDESICIASNQEVKAPVKKPSLPPRPALAQHNASARPALPGRPSQVKTDSGKPQILPPRPPKMTYSTLADPSDSQRAKSEQDYFSTAIDELALARPLNLRLEELWFAEIPPRQPPEMVEMAAVRLQRDGDEGNFADYECQMSFSSAGSEHTSIYACLFPDFSRYFLKLDWNSDNSLGTVRPLEKIYPPPPKPSTELLLDCANVYGQWIHQFCLANIGIKIRNGICMDLINEAIDSLAEAMQTRVSEGSPDIVRPLGSAYGALVYLDRGPQWKSDRGIPRCRWGNDDHLRPGDILWLGPQTTFEWKSRGTVLKSKVADVGHLAIVSSVEPNPPEQKSFTSRTTSQIDNAGSFMGTFFKSGMDKAFEEKKNNETVRRYLDEPTQDKSHQVKGLFDGMCHIYEQNVGGRTTVGPGICRLSNIIYGEIRVYRVMDERWTSRNIQAIFPVS